MREGGGGGGGGGGGEELLEHLLALEELNTWCAHDLSSLSDLGILFDVDFNKMHILIIFIDDLNNINKK